MKTPTNFNINPATLLRIGGGICFFGHGMLALTGKTGFLGLLGSLGLDPIQAMPLLKVIGSIDILVALSILFKPNKLVLQWATLWTALTIVAWGIHGDGLMDLARRVPYVTTPLALLYFLYQGKTAASQALDSQGENRTGIDINGVETKVQTSPEDRIETINRLDLSMICMKLMDEQEGKGWTRKQCAEVAEEYRKFLAMHVLYPDENIVPNLAIDTMWHFHILDTAAYQRDCQAIFGEILHHYPYFGMHGSADENQFMSAFDRTKMLYEKAFGCSMDAPDYLASFGVRQSA